MTKVYNVEVTNCKGKWRVTSKSIRVIGGREFGRIIGRDRSLTYLMAQCAQRAADIIGHKNIGFASSGDLGELQKQRNNKELSLSAGASLFADVEVSEELQASLDADAAECGAKKPRRNVAPKIGPKDEIIDVEVPGGRKITMLSVDRRDAPLYVEMTPANLSAVFECLVQGGIVFNLDNKGIDAGDEEVDVGAEHAAGADGVEVSVAAEEAADENGEDEDGEEEEEEEDEDEDEENEGGA